MHIAEKDLNANQHRQKSIPIAAIMQNPKHAQSMQDPEALKALAISIRHLGLLQPIVVRMLTPFQYELISGRRRLEACHALGFTHIEAVITGAANMPDMLQTLLEGLRCEDLHYLQEAKGYAQALSDTCMSQEALASQLGKSKAAIANKLKLLRLDEQVQQAILQSELSEPQARMLLRLSQPEQQLSVIAKIQKGRFSLIESELLIERMMTAQHETAQSKAAPVAGRVISKVRDYRLYMNAISDIVKQMHKADIAADMYASEEESCIRVTIQIPTRNSEGNADAGCPHPASAALPPNG